MVSTLDQELAAALNEVAQSQEVAPESLALKTLRERFQRRSDCVRMAGIGPGSLVVAIDCGVSLSSGFSPGRNVRLMAYLLDTNVFGATGDRIAPTTPKQSLLFRLRRPHRGLREKPCRHQLESGAMTGISGHSSGRGTCVTPSVYQTTTSVSSIARFALGPLRQPFTRRAAVDVIPGRVLFLCSIRRDPQMIIHELGMTAKERFFRGVRQTVLAGNQHIAGRLAQRVVMQVLAIFQVRLVANFIRRRASSSRRSGVSFIAKALPCGLSGPSGSASVFISITLLRPAPSTSKSSRKLKKC